MLNFLSDNEAGTSQRRRNTKASLFVFLDEMRKIQVVFNPTIR